MVLLSYGNHHGVKSTNGRQTFIFILCSACSSKKANTLASLALSPPSPQTTPFCSKPAQSPLNPPRNSLTLQTEHRPITVSFKTQKSLTNLQPLAGWSRLIQESRDWFPRRGLKKPSLRLNCILNKESLSEPNLAPPNPHMGENSPLKVHAVVLPKNHSVFVRGELVWMLPNRFQSEPDEVKKSAKHLHIFYTCTTSHLC